MAAAQTYVQQQSVVGMDETSFVQKPRWSQSAAPGWLWVMVTR